VNFGLDELCMKRFLSHGILIIACAGAIATCVGDRGEVTSGSGGASSGGAGGGLGTGAHSGAGGRDAAGAGGSPSDDAGRFDVPLPTNGTDDWAMFGHDAGRSFVSTDVVVPPLSKTVWTWTTANTHLSSMRNLVTAGSYVHLHGVGDGPNAHLPGANNPSLITIDIETAGTVRTWSMQNDLAFGDWYAATPTQVVVNDDTLSIVDLATFGFQAAERIDGICQVSDSYGEVVIDVENNRFYAFNRDQFHAINRFDSGFCVPPGNVAAYNLSIGRNLWINNAIMYPVRSSGHLAYAAGVVYYSVVYNANRSFTSVPVPPADGVYAFDAATGDLKWLEQPPAYTTYGAVSTDGHTLYVVAIVGAYIRIQSLDAATGARGWTSPSLGSVPSFGRPFEADPPAYFGSAVFVYTGQSLTALDRATGSQLWTVPNLDGVVSQNGNHLAISGGSGIIYLTDATSLRAFRISDGSPVWNQTIAGVGKVGPVILAQGRALVVGASGVVALASP
jgi:hypothetical protein